jgi:ABC-type sugar transport system ATPase subunit
MIDGKKYRPGSVRHAINAGFAYVPSDRKTEGLFLDMPVEYNVSSVVLRKLLSNKLGVLQMKKEEALIDEIRGTLYIGQREWQQIVSSLSGGNQQKVVLGKWLKSNFKILMMDEPTRGIDISTKHEIYRFLRELTNHNDLAILAVSTESSELLGISDRIYIFYEGKVHAHLDDKLLKEENLTHAIMGL